jgi:K+/H+ antiporter YhaU regulatory subunit KhtT
VEFCPEEALELVSTDEEAEKRFAAALEKMPAQCEELTTTVKNKDWKPLLAEAEKRSAKVAEKLEALNKKGTKRSQ